MASATTVEDEYTRKESLSAVGVATFCVTLGYTLGASTWPGKSAIWITPLAILFVPTMLARGVDRLDIWREKQDYARYRRQLVRLSKKKGISDEHKKKILKKIEDLDMTRVKRIEELSKRKPVRPLSS